MPTRESRILGSLLALHAGDSLGAPLEFKSHRVIKFQFPDNSSLPRPFTGGGTFNWAPGAATDDTDLTRAVLLAYHDVVLSQPPRKSTSSKQKTPFFDDDEFSELVVMKSARYFQDWYAGNWPGRQKGVKPKDVGGATSRAICRFAKTSDPWSSGDGQGSAGNGSLMRCLPTGLFQPDPQRVIVESRQISAITHDDTTCTIACAVYNTIIHALINGSSPREAVSAGEQAAISLEDVSPYGPVRAAIALGKGVNLAELADKGPQKDDFPLECSGYVLDSLSLAISALLDEKRDLEDILVDVVRIGKDTDTNAAIAGGLLGARDGEEGIPKVWINNVEYGDEFREIVGRILRDQR